MTLDVSLAEDTFYYEIEKRLTEEFRAEGTERVSCENMRAPVVHLEFKVSRISEEIKFAKILPIGLFA